jgi:colanic acid/amylovoran biosynthesis glycosyltransferase
VSGEVRELRRQGVDVTVYAGPPNTRDWSWDDDVPVQPLATATGRRLRSLAPLARLALTRPRALAGDLRDRRTCAREKRVTPLRRLAPALQRLRREGTHHIHVHFAAGAALDALRAERLTGIPFSVTAHAYELFGTPANLAAKIGEAAFVTVPCAYNLQQLERRGLPTGRTRVRMLGTDTRAVRRMAPLPDDGLTLAVGRLVEKKGFHVLVEAAARRELGPVCIVGDGPWRARLEELIRAHGLQDRVTLAGAAAPRDIRGWMERAGVMVIPSVVTAGGDQDALPVVAWEALAMELPVVATAVAGLPEVVLPPWGRVVGPGDPDALADAIAAWRAAPYDGRVAAGRAGREWLERNHTQERAVAGLLEQIDPRARVRAGGR